MMDTTTMYDNILYAALLFYFIIVGRYLYYRQSISAKNWLALALVCWPLFMFDEWIRLWDASKLIPLYGLSDVFAVLLITCCYRVIKPMLLAHPTQRSRLWAPVIATTVFQSAILLISVEDKTQWVSASPSGSPFVLWPVYLASLFTCFSVLLMGILITEHIQKYHRHLPEQVADVKRYQIPRLAGIMGSTVGVAFMCILLVSAATFGFFTIPFWESLYHVSLGSVLLFVLLSLTHPRKTSPSPLNYRRLDEGIAKPAEMRAVIEQAERTMKEEKCYKTLGLTLKNFSEVASVDPTSLAIALQWELKKNFRSFVYGHRLDYAKKVLLRSDEKVEHIAKRLGLNSEKFLGEVLVRYLENIKKTPSK